MKTRRRALSVLAGLVAVVAGLSCSDRATGPQLPVRVLLAPVMPHIPNLSAALGITNFRVIIGNPPKVDTSYAFGPTTDSIVVNLTVPNSKKGDALPATIQGRAGTTVLFSGSVTVTAQDPGSPVPPQSTPITIKYVGAGANAASITMSPRDTAVLFGDSVNFRVNGLDSTGASLSAIPTVISSADTSVRIRVTRQPNTVVVPQRKGFAWIVATTATGITDSTRLFFSPVPVVIAKLAGDAQSGVVGTALAVPLTVQVKAADSSGVPNLPITFSSLSGGSVQTATVVTDTNGIASVPATLGPITGAQQFQAVAPKLPPVTFSATALPGTPKSITIQTGNAQTGAVGAVLPVAPAVVIKDSLGNVVPGVKVFFTKVSSSTSRPVNDSSITTLAGVATSGGWRMGTTPRLDSLVATTSVGSVTFTATATVAPAFKVIAASGDAQTAIEGTALSAPLVAKVVDSLNNGVAGVTVNFATASGTLAPASGVSNAAGTVSSTWTLPLGPGAKTATASVTTPTGVTPFTFSATALPVTPTLFVSVLGSNVVGVLRPGTIVVRTSAPVPAGPGPLVVALTSSAPSTLTLGASTVNIIPGDSVATVPVTGGSVAGSSTVTASALGYISGVLNVPVSFNFISSGTTLNVGLGQVASLPITLTAQAPAGGAPIAVNSSAPLTVFVTTPTVNIAQGGTTGSASVRGDALGSATIALTNPNYAPFTVTANVTAALKWKPTTATAYAGGLIAPLDTIQLLSAGVPIAAPAGGVPVTFTSTNPACVANGSGTIPQGTPNLVIPITYAGTAPLPCTAKLAASASAGVTPDSLSITVNPKPLINVISNLTVGRGLQVNASSFPLSVGQHGGVTVTIQVADSSKIRLSPTDTGLGGGTLNITVPNGQTFVSYYVHALEGKGANDSVAVTISAPGFTSGVGYVQLRNIALRLDNAPIGGTTSLSARTLIAATVGYLSSPTTIIPQNVRAGATPRNISFISSTPAVARLRGGFTGADTTTLFDSLTAILKPATLQTNPSFIQQGAVGFQPIGAGTDTLRLNTTDTTITLVPTLTQRTVPITAPSVFPSAITLGRGLQASTFYQALQVPAPVGGTTLTVINPTPTLLKLSTNDSALVGDTLTLPLTAGTQFVSFYIHALEGLGPDTAITLRVKAVGYVDSTFTVNLRNSAYRLISLPTTTTSISPKSFFSVQVGYITSQQTPTSIAYGQPIRAQAPPVVFTIINDSLAVGSLLTQADSTVGRDTVTVALQPRFGATNANFIGANAGVAFLPTGGGATTIRGVLPRGATFAAGPNAQDTITVSAPLMIAAGNLAVVGRGLAVNVSNQVLGTQAPVGGPGVPVTITSADSTKLKIGLTDSTLSGSVQFTVPAGGFSLPNLYYHALEGTAPNDSVNVSITGVGYTPATSKVYLRNVGVQLINVPSSTTTLSAPTFIAARVGYLNNPTDAFLSGVQNLRAQAAPLVVTITDTTPTIVKLLSAADSVSGVDSVTVTIKQRQNASPFTYLAGGVAIRPLTAGIARFTKSAAGFKSVNSSFSDSLVITSPTIGAAGPLTVGAGLQLPVSFVSLGAPAPAGTFVTIVTSNGALAKISATDSTAGVDSLTIPVPTGQTFFNYYVQGFEGANGTATLRITANGYSQVTHTVNVVPPAVSMSLTTNTPALNRAFIQALVGTPNGNTVNAQAVRAGGPGPLSVTFTSGSPSIYTFLTPADTINGAGSVTAQIPARSFGTASSLSQPGFVSGLAKAPGTSLVSVAIPGYISTVNAAQTVTVTTPTISSNTVTVGAGLQVATNSFLQTQYHGGRAVTITSTDPTKLLVSPNDSTPGTSSITINVPDRQTTISYYVQGVETAVGGVDVTIAATGFQTSTAHDSTATPMVEISGINTTATAANGDQLIQIRVGVPNLPVNPTFISQVQAVRFNAATPTPLALTVTAVPNPAGAFTLSKQSGVGLVQTVNVVPRAATAPTSLAAGAIFWRPLATGTGTISVTSPGFLTIPTTSTRTVTVP